MKQLPLAIGALGAGPEQSFASFVPGTNGAALAHLVALGDQAPPVYLWGPPGCGKSHLLHALALRWQDAGAVVVRYASADPAPWTLPPAAALILFDDCDAFDAAQQHAAFTLFVEAATRQLPVVAAGRVPPVDLPLREDLRTRLGWGHVFALQPLSETEVRAALRREADRRGVFLSDEVMAYLLTRFARDLKHLMAQLDHLDRYSLANKRAITVPLLKQMIADGEAAAAAP